MQLLALALLAAIIWFWWDSSGVHEIAVKAARQACQKADLQLLDATVTLRRIRPQRDEHGRLKLARLYSFEFTETGALRNYGYVVTLDKRIFRLELDRSQPTTTS
ncbi:MAG: DUF3301 domain-containing protein [Gammaproteobacteria bacterium]|nr:DUF3301 domain-containing protein [Gammaproteobacteria bacterium]